MNIFTRLIRNINMSQLNVRRMCQLANSMLSEKKVCSPFQFDQIIRFQNRHQYYMYWKNIVNHAFSNISTDNKKIYNITPIKLLGHDGHTYSIKVDINQRYIYESIDMNINDVIFLDKNMRPVAKLYDYKVDSNYINIICPNKNKANRYTKNLFDEITVYYILVLPSDNTKARALNALEIIKNDPYLLINPENINKYIKNTDSRLINDSCIEDYKQIVDKPDDMCDAQYKALLHALNHNITIIRGPPGTGKTTTLVNIIWHLVKHQKAKILVCTSSNIATQVIASKLKNYSIKSLNVFSKYFVNNDINETNILTNTKHLTFDNSNLYIHTENINDLPFNEKTSTTYKPIECVDTTLALKSLYLADVVCCTCVMAGKDIFNSVRFDCVIVDEAAQILEFQCIIPLILTNKKIILAGDQNQLGPYIWDNSLKKLLKYSLFERLQYLNIPTVLLDEQFRMYPSLVEYISNQYYEGRLKTSPDFLSKVCSSWIPNLDYDWPNKAYPVIFYSIYGDETSPQNSYSYFNLEECDQIAIIIEKLLKNGIKSSNIGIITPYTAQRDMIKRILEKKGNIFSYCTKHIEVSNINGYQGREKDYIILSCVRSNKDYNIGFVNDHKQLNVAISRAKRGLFIIGNPKMLSKSDVWQPYLDYLKSINVVVNFHDY